MLTHLSGECPDPASTSSALSQPASLLLPPPGPITLWAMAGRAAAPVLNMASPIRISLTGFTLWSSTDCAQQHHYICKFTPLH